MIRSEKRDKKSKRQKDFPIHTRIRCIYKNLEIFLRRMNNLQPPGGNTKTEKEKKLFKLKDIFSIYFKTYDINTKE